MNSFLVSEREFTKPSAHLKFATKHLKYPTQSCQGPEARERGVLREAGHRQADRLWLLEPVRPRPEPQDELRQPRLLRARDPARRRLRRARSR